MANSRTRAAVVLALAACVIAAVAGCGKDSNPSSPPATADVTIEIVANSGATSYSPSPQVVTAGQTVSWHNADGMTHTATANGGAFDTGNIASGATSNPITMTTTGALAYHCAIHPSMVGALTVNP
jgi:plastocyanin